MINSFRLEVLPLVYSFKIVHNNMHISFILYVYNNVVQKLHVMNAVIKNTFMFMTWHLITLEKW